MPLTEQQSEILARNLVSVLVRIETAAQGCGREPTAIRLVAVTKKSPIDWVRPLSELGATDLGENYPQEVWKKTAATAGLAIRWHLIGHLQKNKAKRTLGLVHAIHSVDSLELLALFDSMASEIANPPFVCLQVNTSEEPSKHGWSVDELVADAEAIAGFVSIPIAGLMTMAPFGTEGDSARPYFARLRELRDDLSVRTGLALPELSMGMSGDFEAAVEEGATLVRIGSALFDGMEDA